MADKKSFIVYYGIKETIDEMTDEQVGQLFRAMVEYEVTGAEPDFTGIMKFAWIPIRQTLTREGAKYAEIVEKRRKAGQKGGIASALARSSKTVENTDFSKQNQANEANQADNVNVNVNVNDNVNVSVNDNEGETPSDDDTQILTFGVLKNVELTQDQYDEIRMTYQKPKKLIDKVSTWLPDAQHPPSDHFALVHRFALNDDWPKKPKPEPPPLPEEPKEYVAAPEFIKKKMLEVL